MNKVPKQASNGSHNPIFFKIWSPLFQRQTRATAKQIPAASLSLFSVPVWYELKEHTPAHSLQTAESSSQFFGHGIFQNKSPAQIVVSDTHFLACHELGRTDVIIKEIEAQCGHGIVVNALAKRFEDEVLPVGSNSRGDLFTVD